LLVVKLNSAIRTVAFNFKIQIIKLMKLLIAKFAEINSKCSTSINIMLLDSIILDELEVEALDSVIKVCQLYMIEINNIMEITVEILKNKTSCSHISITTVHNTGTTELKTHPCCLPTFSKTVGTCTTKMVLLVVSKTLGSSMKAEIIITEASQTAHKRNHIYTKTSASNNIHNNMNMDNGDQTKTQTGHLPSRLRHSLG
jgi:hypothetical protein